MAHDGVDLDLTGENVQPETLDARASLGLAVALVEAIVAIGDYEELTTGESPFFLALTTMKRASVHLAFVPVPRHADTSAAYAAFQHAAKRLPLYLMGHERIPNELKKPLKRLREAVEWLPSNVRAAARIADETLALSSLATPNVQLITSAETFRALVMRAGGSRPRVTLRTAGQKAPFTADIAKAMIESDDFHVYREADISGIFRRDQGAIGHPIVSGEVTNVRFLEKVDRVTAFDEWYEKAGRPWAGVEDIEEELRRRGSH